jgi:hypothetical protein
MQSLLGVGLPVDASVNQSEHERAKQRRPNLDTLKPYCMSLYDPI